MTPAPPDAAPPSAPRRGPLSEGAARLLASTSGRWRGRTRAGRESTSSYFSMQWGHARDVLNHYLEEHAPLADHRVLDVGCGHGGATAFYGTVGTGFIVGLDYDAGLLPRGHADLPGNVVFMGGDAVRLPFAADIFDLAILDGSMEHFPDPAASLREIRRVLRPGGRMVLNFPSWRSPWAHHVYDFIPVPWAHLLVGRATLARAVDLAAAGQARREGADPDHVAIWRSRALGQLSGGLNRITMRGFRRAVAASGPWRIADLTVRYWWRWSVPLAAWPDLGEFFMRHVDVVLEKSETPAGRLVWGRAFRAPLRAALRRRFGPSPRS